MAREYPHGRSCQQDAEQDEDEQLWLSCSRPFAHRRIGVPFRFVIPIATMSLLQRGLIEEATVLFKVIPVQGGFIDVAVRIGKVRLVVVAVL